MRLDFYEWNAGERGRAPDSIDGLTLAQAIRVMNTLSAALDPEAAIRARLVDDAGGAAEFHITPRRVIAS